jgi:hypothetical protein
VGVEIEGEADEEAEAHALARTIRAYWEERGKFPLVWVAAQPLGRGGLEVRYVVKSNIVGGLVP